MRNWKNQSQEKVSWKYFLENSRKIQNNKTPQLACKLSKSCCQLIGRLNEIVSDSESNEIKFKMADQLE